MAGRIVYCGGRVGEKKQLGVLLRQAGFSLRLAPSRKLQAEVLSDRPQAVIIDMGCGEDPKAVCRRLKADTRTRGVPVLLICASNAVLEMLEGFGAGPDDCLARPFDLRVLVAHIRAIIRRQERAPVAGSLRAGPIRIDLSSYKVTFRGKPVKLTPVEFMILERLVRHRGALLRRREILDYVRGSSAEGLAHALEAHISNLRRKLGGGRRMIETVHRMGYRLNV